MRAIVNLTECATRLLSCRGLFDFEHRRAQQVRTTWGARWMAQCFRHW